MAEDSVMCEQLPLPAAARLPEPELRSASGSTPMLFTTPTAATYPLPATETAASTTTPCLPMVTTTPPTSFTAPVRAAAVAGEIAAITTVSLPHHCVVHGTSCAAPVYGLLLVAGRVVVAAGEGYAVQPLLLPVPQHSNPPIVPAEDNNICRVCRIANGQAVAASPAAATATVVTPVAERKLTLLTNADAVADIVADAGAETAPPRSVRRETMVLAPGRTTPGLPTVKNLTAAMGMPSSSSSSRIPRGAPLRPRQARAKGATEKVDKANLRRSAARARADEGRHAARAHQAAARRGTSATTHKDTTSTSPRAASHSVAMRASASALRASVSHTARPYSPRFRTTQRSGVLAHEAKMLQTPSSPLVRRERGERFEPGCLAQPYLPPRRPVLMTEDSSYAARVEALLAEGDADEELMRRCMQGSTRVARSPQLQQQSAGGVLG